MANRNRSVQPYSGQNGVAACLNQKMMTGAHEGMRNVKGGPGNRLGYCNITKIGKDGKQVNLTLQNTYKGAIGPDGKKITERHQMYENTGTGL